MLPFKFDVNEALKAGVYISGQRGSGKTNLAKYIVDELLNNGIKVVVFDISEEWLRSSIPYVITITNPNAIVPMIDVSVLYEIPTLYNKVQKDIIVAIVQKYFMDQVNLPKEERKWIVFVFEESQMLLPQGRLISKEAQELLRLITVGRNFKLSYILISQRSSMVDKIGISQCYQKYLGFSDEPNDIKYLTDWLEGQEEKLSDLKIGEFLYQHGKTIERIITPIFKTDKIPNLLSFNEEGEPVEFNEEEPEEQPYPYKRGTKTWKKHYALRTAAERVFSRLKGELCFDQLKVRWLWRVNVHFMISTMAMLAVALTAHRIGQPELAKKINSFKF